MSCCDANMLHSRLGSQAEHPSTTMTSPTSTPHAKQRPQHHCCDCSLIYQPVLTNHIPALVHELDSLCIQALQFPRLRFSNFPLTPEALTLAVQPTDDTNTHAFSSIQSQCTTSFSQKLLRNRTNPQVPPRHKLSSVHP